MRLTTEFREAPAGAFTAAKHWNLCCHVEFSREERAVIEQRGLHELYLNLPAPDRPPGELAYAAIGYIRPGAKVLLVLAAIMIVVGFVPAYGEWQYVGTWLLLIGIGLWMFSWWKEHDADKRLVNREQQITVGTLLSHPDFSVYAYTYQQAQQFEIQVRDQLSELSQRVKATTELRAQATYEL